MLYNIQFLRFIAAVLVVAHHTFSIVAHKVTEDYEYTFDFGAVGVHIFFVISGFIIIYTKRKHFGAARPLHFLFRRVERIYPLYWFCCLLTVGVILVFDQRTLPSSLDQWIGAFLLTPSGSGRIIFVGWTLAYEMYFYVVFATLLAVGLNMFRTLVLLSAVFFVAVVIGAVWEPGSSQLLRMLTSPLLLEFALGAWIAYGAIKLPKDHFSLGLLLTAMGVACFIGGFWAGYDTLPLVVSWGLPSGLIVAGLVLLEPTNPEHNPLTKYRILGDASYALYLIHPAVIIVLVQPILGWSEIDDFALSALLVASLMLNICLSLLIVKYIDPRLKFSNLRGRDPA